MKIFNLTLLTLCVTLGLTACSSKSNDKLTKLDDNNPTLALDSTFVEANKNGNYSGVVASQDYDQKKEKNKKGTIRYNGNVKLVLASDSNAITIIPIENENFNVSTRYEYKYSAFSSDEKSINDDTKIKVAYAFGEITPASVVANKTGTFIYSDASSGSSRGDFYWKVNFDKKEIGGFESNIADNKETKVAYAKINGNKFSGNHARKEGKFGIEMTETTLTKGQFNGPDAQEMSGIMVKTQQITKIPFYASWATGLVNDEAIKEISNAKEGDILKEEISAFGAKRQEVTK